MLKRKETTFAGLLGIVMIAVLGLVSLPLQTRSLQSTSTTTSSSSGVGANGTSFYRSNGIWNFSVTLSSLVLPAGQFIDANFTLTNISEQNQTIYEANPLVNPVVYSEHGMAVWASYEFAFNSVVGFGAGDEQQSYGYKIPTATLDAGQDYTLSVWPLIEPTSFPISDTYHYGQSLMTNATISITSESGNFFVPPNPVGL